MPKVPLTVLWPDGYVLANIAEQFDIVDLLKKRCEKWNEHLRGHAAVFAKEHEDASVVFFSSHAIFSSILDEPSRFGLDSMPVEESPATVEESPATDAPKAKNEAKEEDQSEEAEEDMSDEDMSDDEEDKPNDSLMNKPPVYNTQIWLDTLHLTGKVHAIIARAMVEALDQA